MLADWFGDSISPLDILAMDQVRLDILRACRDARKRRLDAQAKK